MNAETYSIFLVWSDEDEAFLARVLELPGCMAHGQTRQEAMREIEIAIENWVETARELGREIPPPKHFDDYEKQAEKSAEETLKELEVQLPDAMAAAMPAIAPVLVEALAKEMAKSGQDVAIFYNRLRGLRWLTQSHQKETVKAP
jgi:predicted RNase H-like HicB family nuclease